MEKATRDEARLSPQNSTPAGLLGKRHGNSFKGATESFNAKLITGRPKTTDSCSP